MPTPVLRQIDNEYYYVFWSEKRRSRRESLGTKEAAEAERRFAHWLLLGSHRKSGPLDEDAKQSLTVSELWQIYDERHVQKETASPKSIESSWKNLSVHFGNATIDQVDEDLVKDYEDARAIGAIGRPSKPATIRKELIALRACFSWHANPQRGKRRLLESRDLPNFILPEESAPRERWLRTEEIAALMAAAQALHPNEKRMSRAERFLWLALETAARKQAILDLTWDRVDFEIGAIDFQVPGQRRTKKKKAVVPISRALMPILKRMHDERGDNKLVMDNGSSVWFSIQIIVERSGIIGPRPPRAKGQRKPQATGISPHTLRHTAATHMARRGVPLYDIAGILGNSLAMVEKVYAKHCPDRLRAAVNSISSGFLEAAE